MERRIIRYDKTVSAKEILKMSEKNLVKFMRYMYDEDNKDIGLTCPKIYYDFENKFDEKIDKVKLIKKTGFIITQFTEINGPYLLKLHIEGPKKIIEVSFMNNRVDVITEINKTNHCCTILYEKENN